MKIADNLLGFIFLIYITIIELIIYLIAFCLIRLPTCILVEIKTFNIDSMWKINKKLYEIASKISDKI